MNKNNNTFEIICDILDRAEKSGLILTGERMTLALDLDYANDGKTKTYYGNGNLDVSALLASADGDFTHDIQGIRSHINRDTESKDFKCGEMMDCFVPRCGFVKVDGQEG